MKRTRLVALAIISALPLLLASSSIIVAGKKPPLSAFVTLSKKEIVGLGDTLYLIIYVTNKAPIIAQAQTRDLYPNNYVVDSIDVETFLNGVSLGVATYPVTLTVKRDPDIWTATYTTTNDFESKWLTGRWDPIVLPGETNGVLYFGLLVAPTDLSGAYTLKLTIHGTFNQIDPVDLIAFAKFTEIVYP